MSDRPRKSEFAEAPLPGFDPIGPVSTPAPPHHLEHRARLRKRFMEAGPAALADYEMMELVLFRAIPRRDVKPLAKRLLALFGDFNHVISAPAHRLAEVQGVGDAVVQELKIVEAAAHRLARAKVLGKHAITSWSALIDYCRTAMAHRENEEFRVLFLDRKNVLVAGDPTPSEADIAMTERVAAACSAVGVTLHDHVIIGKERDSSFHSLGLLSG
jgi:DNA repair protein RadC